MVRRRPSKNYKKNVVVDSVAHSRKEDSSDEADTEGKSGDESIVQREYSDEEDCDEEEVFDEDSNDEEERPDDESVEDDESSDDDDSTDWIFARIASLHDFEVGQFVENTDALFSIHEEVNKIRHLTKPNVNDVTSSSAIISEQMSDLSLKEGFCASLKELSKVTEFIFEMHYKYSVNFNSNCSDSNDSVLVDIVRSVVRKFMIVLLNCLNVFLTLLVQSI